MRTLCEYPKIAVALSQMPGKAVLLTCKCMIYLLLIIIIQPSAIHAQTIAPGDNLTYANTYQSKNWNIDAQWIYSTMGYDIVYSDQGAIDIDNDSHPELLCFARSGSDGYLWYTLQYNGYDSTYKMDYVSSVTYESISDIAAFDINNDGIEEIIIVTYQGTVWIYRGDNKQLITHWQISNSSGSLCMLSYIYFEDIDNDQAKELVLGDKYLVTYIYNVSNFSLKSKITFTGHKSISIGNVDTSPDIEIVASDGQVFSLKYNSLIIKWDFTALVGSSGNLVKLADADGNNISEIYISFPNNSIAAIDAITNTKKYQIQASGPFLNFILSDITSDGLPDLLYGDRYEGNMYCHEAYTGALIWSKPAPNGVLGLATGDFDEDGENEYALSANIGENGPNLASYVQKIAKIGNGAPEWKSTDCFGQFLCTKFFDLNNDGFKEIITLTSYDYTSLDKKLLLLVFDGQTHELLKKIFPTDGIIWDYSSIPGRCDMVVDNVDTDTQPEIIICYKSTSAASYITLYDGLTFQLEKQQGYSTSMQEITTSDVDGDGDKDIIAADDNRFYYINPDNFQTIYQSPVMYGYPSNGLQIGQINSTPNEELILLNAQHLMVFDKQTHDLLYHSLSDYLSVALADVNGDGVDEIICGSTHDHIYTISGNSFSIISNFLLSQDELNKSLQVTDLGNTPEPEYLFTSYTNMYLYTPNGVLNKKGMIGYNAGFKSSLDAVDMDGDGKPEIVVGTEGQLQQFGSDVYKCAWMITQKSSNNVSCSSPNDGNASVIAEGGQAPYIYQWNNGQTTSSISNLMPGAYTVTTTDQIGCKITDTFVIEQSKLVAVPYWKNESCVGGNNGYACVYINSGTPPYIFTWNSGQTTPCINNLDTGIYHVSVMDAEMCIQQFDYIIGRDSIEFSYEALLPSCHSSSDGQIMVSASNGIPPYHYLWEDGTTANTIEGISAGWHHFTVTDQKGCVQNGTYNLLSPDTISIVVSSTPDNSYTTQAEGTASALVLGGTPPYSYLWDDYLIASNPVEFLAAGLHSITAIDAHKCSKRQLFYVGGTNGIDRNETNGWPMSIFPNPAAGGLVTLVTDQTGPLWVQIQCFDSKGRECIHLEREQITNGEFSFPIGQLKAGIYQVRVTSKNNSTILRLVVQ